MFESTQETLALRDAYLTRGIVTMRSIVDAEHVALATVAGCDAIVSWDCKHMVHPQKIPLYHSVNSENG